MSDLKVSDLTGKNVKVDHAWRVDVYSYANKTRLRFDTEMNDQLKNWTGLALQNGCGWEFWDNSAKKYVPLQAPQSPSTPPPEAPTM